MLCTARDLDTGAMWECPLLIQLNEAPKPASSSVQALGEAYNNISAFRETGDDTPSTLDTTYSGEVAKVPIPCSLQLLSVSLQRDYDGVPYVNKCTV